MRNPFTAPTIAELFSASATASEDRFNEFFPHIRLANGTFKTTTSKRQTDVNERLCEVIATQPNAPESYRILDLAVSSGTGSVELSQQLQQADILHQMFGSDLSMEATCRRLRPFTILSDDAGFIYQVDVAGMAFPNTPPSKLSALVFGLARCMRKIHCLFVKFPQRIQLLSGLARESDVRFGSGDVFNCIAPVDFGEAFDVIRASNILNLAYFSKPQLSDAITNICERLKPGGLLLINRTNEDVNQFTIFKRTENSFQIIARENGGSEIEELLKT